MSLADKADWKVINEKIQTNLQNLGKVLGSEVTSEIDEKSFAETPNKKDLSTFQWAITEGLANVALKGADEKQAVKDGVKSVKMGFGTPEFKLDGTSLVVKTDLGATKNAASVRDDLTEWIMHNLG